MSEAEMYRDDLLMARTEEVKRLRAEVADLQRVVAELNSGRDLQRVMAENERLRAALNEIHNWLLCAAITDANDMAQSFNQMEGIARAALAAPTGALEGRT